MKFNEIPKSVGRFTQEQLDARQQRLSDPMLQTTLEQTRDLLGNDIKKACLNGLDATWKFTLGAPLNSILEGGKTFGSVVGHNFSVKNKEEKRKYTEVPAAMISELLTQYGKGLIDITKLVGNLGVALGRGVVLGTRYTIGK